MGEYGKRQTRRLSTTDRGRRVMVQSRVSLELRDKANRASEALDISMAAYMAELIARDQVDEQGRPSWTPQIVVQRPPANEQPQLGLSA